ncbi:MAG: metallophosphoesterase [Lachnospiraceae bacterium]|nr:metallophosphoesterase [Lachnospiraceae bacterium]
MQSMFGTIFLIAVILAVALLAVGIIDGNRFVTVREEFVLPGLSKECRFVLISDLHNKVYGNKNDKVIDAIQKINPDFIILAGDLVTSQVSEDMTPGIELMNALSRRYRIYYGLGNHESKMQKDTGRFGDKFDRLMKAVSGKNMYVLQNASIDLPEYNIRVTGLDLDLDYFAHFKIRKIRDGYLQETLPGYDSRKCNILIAHNPDYFEDYARWGAQLVLSGHVHGGIMRLPFLGGVIAPSYKFFPKYDGGVFRSGASVMLLGRGLGSHTLPFRFFNPAELCEVVLKPCE